MAPEPCTTADGLSTDLKGENRLQALKSLFEVRSLAWPVAVAILVGFLHYVGRAASAGKSSALGIHHLVQVSTVQDNVFTGVLVVSQLALYVAVAFILGMGVLGLLKCAFPLNFYQHARAFTQGRIGTLVLG